MAPIVMAMMAALTYMVAVWYHAAVQRLEGPYTPDLESPEEWAASLDVALGEAWFQPAPQPRAPRKARQRRRHAPRSCILYEGSDVLPQGGVRWGSSPRVYGPHYRVEPMLGG